MGLIMVFLPAAPASAMTDQWSSWAPIAGTPNNFSTVMQQQSRGFPSAAVATDSRPNVQIPTGSSVFLNASSPPGAKYGSSRNQPYLVLRPKADVATAPSTTTYTFEHPTPDTGWAFVLGDIDADEVQVDAADAQGNPVSRTAIDSWFAGTFNHAAAADLPTWDPATGILRGNPEARDTDGASGWFEPDIRLTSLTFTFTRRSGFPVYQTWFVSRARPIGGTITDTSPADRCPVEDSVLTLVSPFGEVLATTQPDTDGSYDFGEFATQADYTVRVDAPAECAVLGSSGRTVSNRGNDGDPSSRADFSMRVIVPHPISGRVVDDAGDPVAGAELTLSRPDGSTAVTTTGSDGQYLFDDNPAGTGYSVSVTVPAGYVADPDGAVRDGIDIALDPVSDQDFVVVALPSVSGSVTSGGNSLTGVRVVLRSPDGSVSVTTSTRSDGSYDFTGVPAGTYTIEIQPPPGYAGPTSREVTVTTANLPGQDFELSRQGSIGGQVSSTDGSAVDGVEIVVEGPDGTTTIATDSEGRYFLDELNPGVYRITVRPGADAFVVGSATRDVVITEAGEVLEGQDFVIGSASEPTPEPTTPPAPEPTVPTPEPTAPIKDPRTDPDDTTDYHASAPGSLADSGGPQLAWSIAGILALLAGGAVVVRSRRS